MQQARLNGLLACLACMFKSHRNRSALQADILFGSLVCSRVTTFCVQVWQKYDDRLTQYVHYEQLKPLLNELDVPLRIPIPNTAFISISKMRFTLDGRIHCLEVVIALIKNVRNACIRVGNLVERVKALTMIKLSCVLTSC